MGKDITRTEDEMKTQRQDEHLIRKHCRLFHPAKLFNPIAYGSSSASYGA